MRPKTITLEQLLVQERIHICAISETWFEPDSSFKINGYNVFRQDRADGYGGVAILTHSSIQAQQCRIQYQNIGIEILKVKLHNCGEVENIWSIYCPPNIRTSQLDWDHIFGSMQDKSIVLGDFNGHHSNWSSKTDPRGMQIFDSIMENNLVSLNDGRPTRIKIAGGRLQSSSPDISIASTDLAVKLKWNVTNESLGSDHLIIKVTIGINVPRTTKYKRNYKKADWESYKQYLDNIFGDLQLPCCLQEAYDLFLTCILTAADKHIPNIKTNKNPSNKFDPKPYWNSELSKLVAERRLALAQLRGNPTPTNLDALQERIRLAQVKIRQAKSGNWQKFCSSIDEVTSASEMWAKMKWVKGQNIEKPCVNPDTINKMLSNLAPASTCPPQPLFSSSNAQLTAPIARHELDNNIKKKDTAPGCDEISFSMIHNLPERGKSILLELYNKILLSGAVPRQWRDIRIVPIPKPGRDPNSESSLRPISLMSCLCKIFHCIINKRLEWYIEKNSLLSGHTTGFRKTWSCLDNLCRLVSKIQLGMQKSQATIGCFIDIENAYNNVDTVYLVLFLDKIGIGSKLCEYLWNFLKDRVLTAEVNDSIIYRRTGRGLAQGDPLSPLLFNIVTLNICKDISNVNVTQYADDFVLFKTVKSVSEGAVDIQLAVDKLVNLLSSCGLTISATKSKVCIFKRGPSIQHFNVTVNGFAMKTVDHVKYLGMGLDRSLRWKKHINEMTQKISKYLNIIKVLAGSGWGVHQKHLRRLYIAIIRSRLDYGSFLYDTSAKTNLYKLEKVQNQAMRSIGGFIKSTPIHSMQSELFLQPLSIRRRYLACKFWLKSRALLNNPSVTVVHDLAAITQSRQLRSKEPLLRTVHNIFKEVPIHESAQLHMFSLDTWISNINVAAVIKLNLDFMSYPKKAYGSNYLKYECLKYLETNYSTFYQIYTDGSKDENGAGAALYDPQTYSSMKFRIDTDISIMQVELIAIAEALSLVLSMRGNKFVILTDSRSSLQHLARCSSSFRGAPIAYAILKLIMALSTESKDVKLQWIPSHVGITGNEKVDKLAKEAYSDGVDFNYLPTFSDRLSMAKVHCRESWREFFDLRSREKGIWYRTVQPQLPRSPWFDECGLNRTDTVLAMRLRCGHMPLNKFAYLMRKVPSPNCTECDVEEDVYHILMECVRNESARRQIVDEAFYEIGGCNYILAHPMSDSALLIYKLVRIGLSRR